MRTKEEIWIHSICVGLVLTPLVLAGGVGLALLVETGRVELAKELNAGVRDDIAIPE